MSPQIVSLRTWTTLVQDRAVRSGLQRVPAGDEPILCLVRGAWSSPG